MSQQKKARFAPTCKVIVLVDRTKGIEDELWYSSDDVFNFKLISALSAKVIRDRIHDGTFDGEIGDILGLEKQLCGKSYTARRAVLKAAVLEEQAWQRLSSEMRLRRGLDSVDQEGANVRLIRLAKVSEENSCWAREHASMSGLALTSDLLSKEEKMVVEEPAKQVSCSSSDTEMICVH